MRTEVHGKRPQDGSTTDQIFEVADTIARPSRTMTVEPGDTYATGTLGGIDTFQNVFLRDGLDLSIDGLGTLSGTVADEPT